MKIQISILFISLAALLASCSPNTKNLITQNDQNYSIIGGDKVSARDPYYKGVVALVMVDQKTRQPKGLCTASVISEDTLLTAAHCVTDLPEGIDLVVVFGTDIKDKNNQIRKVKETVYHDSYTPEQFEHTNDIGLVNFTGGLPEGVKPVKLAADASLVTMNRPLVITGFGVSSRILSIGSGVLRTNNVKITEPNFSPVEFGVKQFKDGVCSGDSGGPAFVVDQNGEFVQVGIVSRGFDFKIVHCIVNSYFTRVDSMIEWIRTEEAKLRQN